MQSGDRTRIARPVEHRKEIPALDTAYRTINVTNLSAKPRASRVGEYPFAPHGRTAGCCEMVSQKYGQKQWRCLPGGSKRLIL
jgi:hypothetical protein